MSKIDIAENSWLFLLSGVLIILIALIVINSKAISAANSNPVRALSRD